MQNKLSTFRPENISMKELDLVVPSERLLPADILSVRDVITMYSEDKFLCVSPYSRCRSVCNFVRLGKKITVSAQNQSIS
jgi:hypothetical protein